MAFSFPNPKHAAPKNEVYIDQVHSHPGWPRLLAEGDSWFDYPAFDVIKDLEMMGFVAWDVARAGDTIANIRGGNFAQIAGALTMRIIDGKQEPFRCVLFSGGGNDILGDGLPHILKPATPGSTLADWINRDANDKTSLPSQLDALSDSYRDLHNFVQALRPGMPVLVHSYDYAVPTGVPFEIAGVIKLAGPWMKAVLEAASITNPEDQEAVVHLLVDELSAMHQALATEFGGTYRFVDCRGAVAPGQWANEIHPNHEGFRAVAERFRTALDAIA